MDIFRKKEQIPVDETVEVEGAQVWLVTWNSLVDGGYSSPTLVNVKSLSVRALLFFSVTNRDDSTASIRS